MMNVWTENEFYRIGEKEKIICSYTTYYFYICTKLGHQN